MTLKRFSKSIAAIVTSALFISSLTAGFAATDATDSMIRKATGAKEVLKKIKIDYNKDGSMEYIAAVIKSVDDLDNLIIAVVSSNGKVISSTNAGMTDEGGALQVTPFGKNGYLVDALCYIGSGSDRFNSQFHLDAKGKFKALNIPFEEAIQEYTSGSTYVFNYKTFNKKYNVTLPSTWISSFSSPKQTYVNYSADESVFSDTNKDGIPEITLVRTVSFPEAFQAALAFDARQTFAYKNNTWVPATLSAKAYSDCKVVEVKAPAKPAPSKVTIDSILKNGQLPDGLTLGSSTLDQVKKVYGTPKTIDTTDGADYYAFSKATFFIPFDESKIGAVSYRPGTSFFGLTIGKSTSADVKKLLGSKFNIEYSEDDGEYITFLEGSKHRIFMGYNESKVLLYVLINTK